MLVGSAGCCIPWLMKRLMKEPLITSVSLLSAIWYWIMGTKNIRIELISRLWSYKLCFLGDWDKILLIIWVGWNFPNVGSWWERGRDKGKKKVGAISLILPCWILIAMLLVLSPVMRSGSSLPCSLKNTEKRHKPRVSRKWLGIRELYNGGAGRWEIVKGSKVVE